MCARLCSLGKPKKPAVPLPVWTVRKIALIASGVAPFFSDDTSSRSSRSRFSLPSTRNSWRISSSAPMPTTQRCLRPQKGRVKG